MVLSEIFNFCSEGYIIEKIIEVVFDIRGKSETIRIEALQDLKDGHYLTRARIQKYFDLQPTYPQSQEKYDRSIQDCELWVDYDLPTTRGDSADEVLTQALGYLRERTRHKP